MTRILLLGAGAVGGSIATIAARRPFYDELVVADVDVDRARAVVDRTGSDRLRAVAADASRSAAVAELIRTVGADIVVNACDPRFDMPIFEAAYDTGATYLDMALSLSSPHPARPYEEPGVKLGDEQFAQHDRWVQGDRLAIVGMGVDPGLSDVFARHAADELFATVDEVGVRDGSDMTIDGYAFAPTFSIWTAIEECLNPPLVWERDRGFFTTGLFGDPEVFRFPGTIGEVECVNIEHEEVVLVPRGVDCGRVTFKYGLDAPFLNALRAIFDLGLHRTDPVKVKGVEVAPRDVVAALCPDPATLGDRMRGTTCVGTWVTGEGKDGGRREVFLYNTADNEQTMADWGCQAIAWQTAVPPVVALELLATEVWSGAGVWGPEAFHPRPLLDGLAWHGTTWHLDER
jgi:saccharopine dehydrogenase-like NADP-dependent oxidoreductase